MGHQVISRKTLPHVVYCRIWRFADLQSCNELKPVAHCQFGYSHHHYQQAQAAAASGKMNNNNEEQMVCINPYHYDRIECQNGTGSGSNSQQSHQPLTVYVPAKLQLSQQQQQQSSMDGLMPSMGHLVAGGVSGGGSNGGVGSSSSSGGLDDLMTGVSAASFMHSNMQHPVNSPSPPSSASILSPSSIGKSWFFIISSLYRSYSN